MKVGVHYWIVKGKVDVDALWGEHAKDVERYLEGEGIRIERHVRRFLDPLKGDRDEWVFLSFPFSLSLTYNSGGLLLMEWKLGETKMKRVLGKTNGVQVYELVSGPATLLAGVEW